MLPKKLLPSMLKINNLTFKTKCMTLIENHGRHSYKIFSGLSASESDISKTLLNNCCLHDCRFFNCKMDSVDFQGTEFKNCQFFGVSFDGADITSCNFIGCTFEKCRVNYSNLIDNNFLRCSIRSMQVVDATLTNNIWTRTEFFDFAPSDTSIYSNDFIKCNFVKSKLLTSIYYIIFDNCTFTNSVIDSYILGFQFGLKKKDFKNLNIEHFGQNNVDFKSAMRMLGKVYAERQMPLEGELLTNIFSRDTGVNVERLIKQVFACIDSGYVVKVDEIRFIRKIINNLYREEKISMFYYLFIIDFLNSQPLNGYRGALSDNVFTEITILYHLLYSIKMDIENSYLKLSDLLHEQLKINDTLLVEFGYRRCPNFRISDIVSSNTGLCYYPVQERVGSFYEVFQIVKDVIEIIAAVMTILGVSATGIITLAVKAFKKKKKEKDHAERSEYSENDDKILKAVKAEKVIAEETLEVIEEKAKETFYEDNLVIQKSTIYRKIMRTVISHREELITDYDIKNLKNISFK